MGCAQSSSAAAKTPSTKVVISDDELLPPGIDRSLKLDAKDFKVVRYIAEGGMGVVYSGQRLSDNSSVALKFFGYNERHVIVDEICKEVEILTALHGLHGIVNFYGVFVDSKSGYAEYKVDAKQYPVICMELLAGGDMFERIQIRKTVSELYIANIFKDVISALDGVHKRGYLHRDLKPENLMLVNHDEDSPVKVIDFGMMVSLPPDGSVYKSTGAQGTRGFVAPESLRSFEYSPKSDLWQAGCTLYSLLSGLTAFSPHRLEQTLEAQYFKMEGVGWDNVSDQAKELVASILRKDPNERPTAQEILEHSWVAGGAPDTDMGAAYYKRIKNLALKQKMKTFFMDHETLLANKLQKAKLKAVLPFLRPSNRRASQNRIVLNRHMSEDSFRIPSAVDNIRLRRRSVSMDIPDLNEVDYGVQDTPKKFVTAEDVFVIPEGSSESNGSDIVDDGSSEDDFQEKMDKLSHIVMSSLSAKSIYVGTPDQMGNKDTIGNHGVTAPASPEGRVCVQDTGIDYDTFVAAMMECDLKELACPCVFNIFDIDKTGTVDLKDFLVTMVAFRDAARYSGDYADALLDRANADGSHSRDAKEAEDEADSAARFYFNMFDVNHTGCIDQDEMKLAVSCLFADEQQKLFDADAENGHPRFQVSVPDVEALFEAIDTKKTGTIDFEEFQTFYQTVLINSTTNALGRRDSKFSLSRSATSGSVGDHKDVPATLNI